MRMLDRAGCFDGLDACNVACLGDLLRQAQLIEYVYMQDNDAKGKGKGSKTAGVYDESSIFAGTRKEAGDSMVAPDLMEYVAKEVERDASILKQVRKAREERRLAKPNEKDGE